MALRSAAISSRLACMKSTSSGSGLRSVRAMASTPRSATSRRRVSASLSLRSVVGPGLVLVALEALLEGREGLGRLLAGLLHELVEHAVEVEVPQRAVQVVR